MAVFLFFVLSCFRGDNIHFMPIGTAVHDRTFALANFARDPGTKRRVANRITLTAAIVSIASLVRAEPCAVPKGLYQERQRLEREYAEEFTRSGRTPSATTERLLQQEKALDRQYLASMELLVRYHSSGDRDSIRSCCRALEQDPILKQFCALIQYIADGKTDPAAFLASLPRTSARLKDLWTLDVIAGVSGEAPRWVGLPLPGGLVASLTDEVFELAKKDNPGAIEKYLLLYSGSDGELADFMRDRLASLFREQPELVFHRWPIFRRYDRLHALREGISPDESRQIATGFAKICRPKDARCKEIQKMFR